MTSMASMSLSAIYPKHSLTRLAWSEGGFTVGALVQANYRVH
jgi:hypothetical protein